MEAVKRTAQRALAVGLVLGLTAFLALQAPTVETSPPPASNEARDPVGGEARCLVGIDAPDGLPFPVEAFDPVLGLAVVKAPVDEVRTALAGRPEVRFVSPDAWLATTVGDCCELDPARYEAELDAAMRQERERIAALFGEAWELAHGEDVTVAVLDTGVDAAHPDLKDRVLPAEWVLEPDAIADRCGHGTAMASLVAAHNHAGLLGAAPDARVLPVVVADERGRARVSDVARGIRRAVAAGADVILLALGTPVDAPALREAVQLADAEGCVLVAAAGNNPIAEELFPAAYAEVLSVGGLDPDGGLSNLSAVAPGIDVYAPGEAVLVALPFEMRGTVSGTSVAAARVAGLAALLRGAAALTPAQVRGLIRGAAQPIAALAPYEGLLPGGALAPRASLERALSGAADGALGFVRSLPRRPLPGEPTRLRARLANAGAVPLPPTGLVFSIDGAEVARTTTPALAVGEAVWVEALAPCPDSGGSVLAARLEDAGPGNNRAERALECATAALRDLSVRSLRLVGDGEQLALEATLENLGHLPLVPGTARFRLDAVGRRLELDQTLQPGEARVVRCAFPAPALDGRVVEAGLAFETQAGELDTFDNQIAAALAPAEGEAPAHTQYQQSNDVDWILDAPWRINPNVDAIPVLAYAASKGTRSSQLDLELRGLTLTVRDVASTSGAGSVVYDCAHDTASAVPGGLQILDEMGVDTGSTVAFEGLEWNENGRYRVLQLPVAALPYSRPATVFLEAKLRWKTTRHIIWSITTTKTGTHKKVMRIHLADEDLPRLGPDGHYYDVHFHAESEWHFGSFFDILAPRKAYGGPHLMVHLSAHALGLIDDPADVLNKLCITDHNCFYNRQGSNPDHPDLRPPFGLISPSASPGLTELERAREMYGQTAGEEITVSHNGVSFAGINLPIPTGAHMLMYRGQHIEGPWHGGSSLSQALNQGAPVELVDVLGTMAKSNRGENSGAFAYSAHAFGGGFDWGDVKRRRALTRTASKDDEFAHAEGTGFVFKGHQLWNKRTARSLDSSLIDWRDLNPWVDPDFNNGSKRWDSRLWESLETYHGELSELLQFAYDAEPEVVFIRKHYFLAGSDAHGDFNFGESRAASLIDIQSTYSVRDNAFGFARSYVLPEEQAGATLDERRVNALASGNAVCSDGPLLEVRLDAELRFDSSTLSWVDSGLPAADADGRIGGRGAYDGGFTALVPSGAQSAFRYRYAESQELGGPVDTIHIYRTGQGAVNPSRDRSGIPILLSQGSLAPAGPGSWHSEALDAAEEGVVDLLGAFAFGAFTGADPDVADLPVEGRRCYTNPIWAAPVDVSLQVGAPVNGELPAGSVQLSLDFPITMGDSALVLEVKALDSSGVSSTSASAAIATMSGTWSTRAGVKNGRFTATNDHALPLNLDRWPTASTVTFVVYTAAPPEDAFGNALNPIATTFEAPGIGTGGGTGQPLGSTGSGSAGNSGNTGNAGNTGSAATGNTGSTSASGGSGGGGCAVAARPGSAWPFAALLLLVVGLLRTRRTSPTRIDGRG